MDLPYIEEMPRAPLPLALALTTLANAQIQGPEQAKWNHPIAPFRIIGNIYYVGAEGVSSFLITGPSGSVLLDGGFRETAPEILRNIQTLGIPLSDIHYLINSHAHYDHCGGLAQLKKQTGAKLVASQADSATLASGHQLSFGQGQTAVAFPAVSVDRIIADGETLRVGTLTLTAHLTPGHTKGSTTWTTSVTENGKPYRVVFDPSTTVAGNDLVHNPKYPNIVSDYRRSFALLNTLPCDVFLAPHPFMFHMKEKAARQMPWIDPGELKRFNAQSQQDFNAE